MSYKRELVKWQPFNAVIPGNIMVNEVLNEKNKIAKPILSEDQLDEIEKKLVDAFHSQITISIIYYKGGKLYKITGYITDIDKIRQKITINKGKKVYFEQIIKIF